jgi:glycogen(starch) synthase
MRIIVTSNIFPPAVVGGYELGCQDVVEGLRRRGHRILVLTTNYGMNGHVNDANHVWRTLTMDWEFNPQSLTALIRKERRNREAFGRAIQKFQPDLLYVFNAAHLSPAPIRAAIAEMKVVCYLSDSWLQNWEHFDTWRTRTRYLEDAGLHKRLLGRILRWYMPTDEHVPHFADVQFASQYLKRTAVEAGLPVSHAKVVHWGVNPSLFAFRRERRPIRRLLYSGQIMPHKGVHTLIEAFNLLRSLHGMPQLTLTLVGSSVQRDYLDRIKGAITSYGLGDRISFSGQLKRDELPLIYKEHDVLIFPAEWDEPFSLTVLEAMSSGVTVVGTVTGGSGEILQDNSTGLVFAPGKPSECARQVARLLEHPELNERLRWKARNVVESEFRFEGMLDRIEASLQETLARTAHA